MNLIDNSQLIAMIKGGRQNLALNKDYVDSLNVFPVPDGDTGTNMGLTMDSTVRELDAQNPSEFKDTAAAFAKGALKGARGNSGVILSQIFKGMSETFIEAKTITTKVFAKALLNGANKAYKAVTVPKEGTILTVIRIIGEHAVKVSARTADFEQFFTKILKRGEEALQDTPKLLPILAKAGVVDSGGQGLMYILTGMYNVLAGVEMKPVELKSVSVDTESKTVSFESDVHDLENIKFAYCTEFFIFNLKKHVTTADIDKLCDQLQTIGDCVLVVGDLEAVKVHVHTNNPDKALGYALKLGELNLPKIENMLEQNRQLQKAKKTKRKKNGLLSICSGEGFRAMFKELGADEVLEGGQTMNPSVENIVSLVNDINADTVFVLPNNKNIVLACEQAKDMVECELVVVATVNVQQGIAAAMSYDPEAEKDELVDAMTSAYGGISAIQVTHAVRDTEIDGFVLKYGDIIALEDGIVAKGDDINDVVKQALRRHDKNSICLITLYYGEDVKEEDANVLSEELASEYPDADVVVLNGGQAHYFYLISVE